MRRGYGFAGLCGLVLLISAVFVSLAVVLFGAFVSIGMHSALQWFVLAHGGLGGGLLLVWLFGEGWGKLTKQKTLMQGRRARFSVNVGLYTIVFFGILICLNILGLETSESL